jgi:hypothetical protein
MSPYRRSGKPAEAGASDGGAGRAMFLVALALVLAAAALRPAAAPSPRAGGMGMSPPHVARLSAAP